MTIFKDIKIGSEYYFSGFKYLKINPIIMADGIKNSVCVDRSSSDYLRLTYFEEEDLIPTTFSTLNGGQKFRIKGTKHVFIKISSNENIKSNAVSLNEGKLYDFSEKQYVEEYEYF